MIYEEVNNHVFSIGFVNIRKIIMKNKIVFLFCKRFFVVPPAPPPHPTVFFLKRNNPKLVSLYGLLYSIDFATSIRTASKILRSTREKRVFLPKIVVVGLLGHFEVKIINMIDFQNKLHRSVFVFREQTTSQKLLSGAKLLLDDV